MQQQQYAKAHRICMLIGRGTMDKTVVWVFPWERPIIEEIHRGNAEVKTIDELVSSLKEASKIAPIKLEEREYIDPITRQSSMVKPDEAPSLREQFEAMQRVAIKDDPFRDLDAEYNRLENKYGRHADIPISNVDKVFGSAVQFKRAALDYRSYEPLARDPLYPEVGDDADGAATGVDDADLAPADMSIAQLRDALTARGVKLPPRLGQERLVEMLTEELAAEPAG